MALLNSEQKQRALELLKEYAESTNLEIVKLRQEQEQLDKERISMIEKELRPLVEDYLSSKIDIQAFKSKIDSLNRRFNYWGFKGIKGQMFFNQLLNVSETTDETDAELKAAITIPDSEQMASSRIKTFERYVRRIGDELVEAGGSKHGRPKPGSIPFFLSYFWQVQDKDKWPIYYTNSVNTMIDLNLWQPKEDLADDYTQFKQIHEELIELFSQKTGQLYDYYQVEHVFWYRGENPLDGTKVIGKVGSGKASATDITPILTRLPESYVPPIVAILPKMAERNPEIEESAKSSATSLERAFEKHINAAFTILGYETKLLGQGQGRVPDGTAIDRDNSYAVIWDAKVRANGYSLGTDDRSIREYISTQSRTLKRSSLRNIYYAIISSTFADDYDDSIRLLKMETDVSEVCLLEASALVVMVDAKLRSPLHLSLGPDGIQRLFCTSGIMNADTVREQLM